MQYAVMLAAGSIIVLLPGYTNLLFVYPYFIVGFALNEFGALRKYNRYWPCIIIWLILLIFYRKEDFIYISGILPTSAEPSAILNAIGIDAYRWLIGLVGSIAVIGIVKEMTQRVPNVPVKKYLKEIGRYTLDVYVMQRLVLEVVLTRIFQHLVSILGTNYLARNMVVYYIVTLLFSLALISALVWLARLIEENKTLCTVLFGRVN